MERIVSYQKTGAAVTNIFTMFRRTAIALALIFGLGGVAHAASVTLNLTWAVTNTPSISATHYRLEEQVSGVWGTVTTIPAPTLTHQITGRAVGNLYTFRIIPVANGVDGTSSNITVCGALAPDTTLNLNCATTVIP